MKAFIITIMDMPDSVKMAERCAASYEKYMPGHSVELSHAITPSYNPIKIAEVKGIPVNGFKEIYSRFENCISAFLSHYSLWEKCVDLDEPIVIFEHDAVMTQSIPDVSFTGLLNIGHPSYGKWNTPTTLGVNPLTSKRYMPGAHAYVINPKGAEALIRVARSHARPTDVYMHLDIFPWIQELYPWCAVAKDEFTTIQKVEGCRAKHNYGFMYEII